MKIIQANIWHGKLGQQIIDFLNIEKPDLVCLQEVNDLEDDPGAKRFATLADIKTKAGFNDAYMSPTYSFQFMERQLGFGNAILSRSPFTSAETVFTHGEYKQRFDKTKDYSNSRNLQHVTIEVQGQTLHILNHHGYHRGTDKSGDAETLKSIQVIVDLISKLDGPIIVCGDFNLSPGSKSLGLLNNKLRNLSIENGLKRTYTDLSAVHEVCDYIFVNDQVKVQHFEMSETLISDHKPLVLEFSL